MPDNKPRCRTQQVGSVGSRAKASASGGMQAIKLMLGLMPCGERAKPEFHWECR